MPKIIFASPVGERVALDAKPGSTVMLTAVTNGVEGILAECGGCLGCGTCHVYVEPSQLHLLPPVSPAEDAILDMTASERCFNSRLSCQLIVSEAFEGLLLRLPPEQ